MDAVQDAITRFRRRYPTCDEARAIAVFNEASRELAFWFRARRRIRPKEISDNALLLAMCARWEGEGVVGRAYRELAERELEATPHACYAI